MKILIITKINMVYKQQVKMMNKDIRTFSDLHLLEQIIIISQSLC